MSFVFVPDGIEPRTDRTGVRLGAVPCEVVAYPRLLVVCVGVARRPSSTWPRERADADERGQ
jgi:hypothetical protein